MDPNALAGMVFTLIMAAMIGGMVLLYPLSRRLASQMDAKAQRDRAAADPQLLAEVQRLADRVESLEGELSRVRERQEFTESLVARREGSIGPGR